MADVRIVEGSTVLLRREKNDGWGYGRVVVMYVTWRRT